MVEHACRIVVARSRKQYLYPATHYASTTAASQTNVPAMGQRVRLKSGFVIPANWAKEEKALLLGLKKYGALVADNGGFFSISIAPDDRWPANVFSHISLISITNFEVVQSTGPAEGPRSPGAPAADAGPDQVVPVGGSISLPGTVRTTGLPPVVQWTQYSGHGTVNFAAPAQTNTLADFPVAGTYTLMLSAADGVHAVAYDAVVVSVISSPLLSATAADGAHLTLSWSGGSPPFVIETAPALPAAWTPAATTQVQTVTLPISNTAAVFRLLCR
jgi:hypothetical protein